MLLFWDVAVLYLESCYCRGAESLCRSITARFPGAQRMNRGSYVVKDLMQLARSHEMTDVSSPVCLPSLWGALTRHVPARKVILVHEHRGEPDGMVVCHLPFGPTAYFGPGLPNTIRVPYYTVPYPDFFSMGEVDAKACRMWCYGTIWPTSLPPCPRCQNLFIRALIIGECPRRVSCYGRKASPHLLFHGFTAKMGLRVKNILQASSCGKTGTPRFRRFKKALFPPAKQAGDRVMTFANRTMAACLFLLFVGPVPLASRRPRRDPLPAPQLCQAYVVSSELAAWQTVSTRCKAQGAGRRWPPFPRELPKKIIGLWAEGARVRLAQAKDVALTENGPRFNMRR